MKNWQAPLWFGDCPLLDHSPGLPPNVKAENNVRHSSLNPTIHCFVVSATWYSNFSWSCMHQTSAYSPRLRCQPLLGYTVFPHSVRPETFLPASVSSLPQLLLFYMTVSREAWSSHQCYQPPPSIVLMIVVKHTEHKIYNFSHYEGYTSVTVIHTQCCATVSTT